MTSKSLSVFLGIDWANSGSDGTDESLRIEEISGNEGMSPPDEAVFSESGYIPQVTISLINHDGRFSVNNSSSPIYSNITNGNFFQKRVVIKVTINEQQYVIFRGMIKSLDETFGTYKNANTVKIVCRGQEDIYKNYGLSSSLSATRSNFLTQQDESLIIASILGQLGIGSEKMALDKGLFIIPYFWLDNDSPIEDCWSIASACGGRFFYNSQDGKFYYKNAFYYGTLGNSKETFTQANIGSAIFDGVDKDLIKKVRVKTRNRIISKVDQIWSNEEVFSINPNASRKITAELTNPLITYTGYEFRPTTFSGFPLSNVTLSEASYSNKIELTITNNNSNNVAYVKELKLFGQVLEPAETINYERESDSNFWISRSGIEKSLTSNAYIQTYAQAKSIGDIIFDRQTKYNSILKINNYLGNQFLRVGDRVTVNIPNRATGEFFIVRNDWSINSSGLRQNFELLSFSGIYGQSSDSYFIIGSNKTADNKKLFY